MNHGMVHALGTRRLETCDDDFYIAPGVQVIGSVRLGAGASLWFNAVLRGDDELIDIGAGSNIQDGSVIHADHGVPTRIGSNVTVGHMALLHGCTIGADSLVGNGAIVLDRAHVGSHCVVAAGALVPPGAEIPDNSLAMGVPAKVIREVTERDLAMIAASAAHYRERSRRYLRDLKPLV